MSDGHGNGFSTLAMLTENEVFWSHGEFLDLSGQWLGLSSYFITVNPENYGIQHIDCSVKILDEETLLLKQVEPSHPDYARLETINDQLTTAMGVYGREYEIVRIYCGYYSGSDAAAYTNSYILNNKVFVPMFGIPSDDGAIATYQQAMPGYDVIGIPFNAWYYYDALHCRVREIMDPGMLLIWHRPLRGEVSYADQFQVEVEIRRYSGSDLILDETEILWRADSGPWQSSPLNASAGDSLYGFIPGQPPSTQIDYYITAADQSGRKETLPRPAPDGYFSFTVSGSSSIEEDWLAAVDGFSVHPNPVVTTAVISLAGVPREPVTVDVYSMDGRLVDTMTISGQPSVHWNASGLKPGCYLIRAVSGGTPVTQRIAVVR
jgi:agmatine deiminase